MGAKISLFARMISGYDLLEAGRNPWVNVEELF
jgi:hypothetical protein